MLHINLSQRSFEEEFVDEEIYRKLLGGKGLATHLLLSNTKAGADPLSEDNAVIFAVGPTTDTKVFGSSRYGVFTKSPLTGIYCESYAGGNVAEAISRTGYDAIIIKGASNKPAWLEISNRSVKFHDASHIWGKDTYQTEGVIQQEVGVKDAGVAVIGPAGERLVRFAVQIMGVIAEFERGRIGQRVKDSRRYLISRGNWPGGRTLYGYRWLPEERKWEVLPEEAKTVRRIYDLYVNGRIGTESIVATLNKGSLRTRDGARWSLSTVRQVLTHPGYKGRHQIGIPMPAIIDENTWQLAQQRREDARSVLADPKGWLLQGMCFCGQCGHVLKCLRKKPREPHYYACRGRVQHRMTNNCDKRCNLPYIRTDWLEWQVWRKVKAVLNNSDKLTECVNKALIELEERKSQIGAETLAIDNRLEAIQAKEERLGIAFADGAVSESVYKSKLNQLKKQEAALLKCRHNIDPLELTELAMLEGRIAMVKDVLSQGTLSVTEFGIFGEIGHEYIPTGFNAWRDCDGELAIGEAAEMGTFRIEGTDKVMRGIDAPPGFWECEDHQKREENVKRNMRAILQLFNIRVLVYPERVEIKGTIPTQVLDRTTKEEPETALIIHSPSLIKGGGISYVREASPLFDSPLGYFFKPYLLWYLEDRYQVPS